MGRKRKGASTKKGNTEGGRKIERQREKDIKGSEHDSKVQTERSCLKQQEIKCLDARRTVKGRKKKREVFTMTGQ